MLFIVEFASAPHLQPSAIFETDIDTERALLESFIRHHERHFVIGIVPLHVSEALCCDVMRIVPAKRARAAGISPAAHALRSDVVRRAASRGGTLRCAKARRVAYRDVDKSYASHRLS